MNHTQFLNTLDQDFHLEFEVFISCLIVVSLLIIQYFLFITYDRIKDRNLTDAGGADD